MFLESNSTWQYLVWASRITFRSIWYDFMEIWYQSWLILKNWLVAIRFTWFLATIFVLFCDIPLTFPLKFPKPQSIHQPYKILSRISSTHYCSKSSWYKRFRYVWEYVSRVAQMLVEVWCVFLVTKYYRYLMNCGIAAQESFSICMNWHNAKNDVQNGSNQIQLELFVIESIWMEMIAMR